MKKTIMLITIIAMLLSIGACSTNAPKETHTDLTVWTYYNSTSKDAFDALVTEFNQTVGIEKNIMIDAYSQGDVNQLADAIVAAANKDVGSEPMPHIFSAYPDNAYSMDKLGLITDLENYFTPEELLEYREEFLEGGRLTSDGKLKIIPIAKSTENLSVNATDFEKFASATGASLEDLKTWEGLAKTAEKYYDYTDNLTEELYDGKALFGIDSMANFMLTANKQLNNDLYEIQDEYIKISFPKEVARTIWDNFYTPFVSGHYAAIGRFRSDDAKTGDIISYVGSTAGVSFFPTKVEMGKDSAYEITAEILPYPVFESGTPVAMQQGAGMTIAKSDETHEKAAAIFLKWLTAKEQSAKFASLTNYLPVKKDALTFDYYQNSAKEAGIDITDAAMSSAKSTYLMLDTYDFYDIKPFATSFDARKVLDSSLIDFARADMEVINNKVAQGGDRQALISEYSNTDNFETWYTAFLQALDATVNQ